MAGEWRARPLAELTENFDAIRVPVKESDRRTGPYPYYGASGIVDYVDNYLFNGEYLLIAEDGENLRTQNTPIAFLARGKFWVNNHAHILRGNNEADTRFLMYALSAVDISGYLTGSTMPKLTQNNLNRIPLLTPPLPEQRSIARILGTLDDKIALNRRMNETLEAIACAIFQSWFVDFDPVLAKMEGRQPPGMDAETAALFPDALEDSVLGKIPAGWRVGRVGDFIAFARQSLDPSQYPDEMFDHYSIPAFDDGRWPKVETGGQIKSNKLLVPPEAVLLSKLNPRFPRVWLPAVDRRRRSICSTEFLVALPSSGTTREYVYGLFTSNSFREGFTILVTGTSSSHQRVRPEDILEVEVVLPSRACLIRFSDTTKSLHALVIGNIQQCRALGATRDALLPKLLSGEIRLKEGEKVVERAV